MVVHFLHSLISSLKVGTSDPTSFPIQKKGASREFLRTIAHLRPRTNTFGASFVDRHWNENRKPFLDVAIEKSSQIRQKMREIMVNQATSCDLKELVQKFIREVIDKEIEKATSSIYRLQNVFIQKVKILKAPKCDLSKLKEVLQPKMFMVAEEAGRKVELQDPSWFVHVPK